MGIPKLISTLQPYAERVILGHDDGNVSLLQTTSLIIDGPSLIYHLYHRLLCLKANQYRNTNPSTLTSQNPLSHILSQQPTYTEINQAVRIFLTYLQGDSSNEIQKIYFDGGLPEGKRDVRIARLEDGRKKLVEFRRLLQPQQRGLVASAGADNVHDDAGGAWIKAEDLFQSPTPLPAMLKYLPPPPFMVPAAIESLRSTYKDPSSPTTDSGGGGGGVGWAQRYQSQASCFSSVIELVPGEADTHCASHAARTGAAILTSDSDLIAYDLGLHGSVILLNSLELAATGPQGSSIKERVLGMRFHPASLATKMGIPHSDGDGDEGTIFQRFCFERWRDTSVGTLELKLRCGRPLRLCSDEKVAKYRRFLRQYSTVQLCAGGVVCGRWKSTHLQPRLQIQGLDPRLAELATQFESLHQDENGSGELKYHEEGEVKTYMYLPLLLEDPTRDSAWSYGSEIRSLAYMLLRHAVFACTATSEPHKMMGKTIVREYQRRGTRITDLPISISLSAHAIDHLTAEINSILHFLNEHQRDNSGPSSEPITVPSPSHSQFWKSFALTIVSEQRTQNGKQPLAATWTKQYFNFNAPTQHQRPPYTPTSWEDVHTQANVEAVLYSLRMLKQVACTWLQVSSSSSTLVVKSLVEVLERLPPIEDIMGYGGEIRHVEELMKEANGEVKIEDMSRVVTVSGSPLQSMKRVETTSQEQEHEDSSSDWVQELSRTRKRRRRLERSLTEQAAKVQVNHNNMFKELDELDE